jgi:alpha-galactosidase
VALFNRGASAAEMTVNWAGLKLKPSRARDLWEHQDVKLSGAEYKTTVPSHGVVLLRVK